MNLQANKLHNAHRKLVLTAHFKTSGHPEPVHQKPLTTADMSKFRLFCDLQDIMLELLLLAI